MRTHRFFPFLLAALIAAVLPLPAAAQRASDSRSSGGRATVTIRSAGAKGSSAKQSPRKRKKEEAASRSRRTAKREEPKQDRTSRRTASRSKREDPPKKSTRAKREAPETERQAKASGRKDAARTASGKKNASSKQTPAKKPEKVAKKSEKVAKKSEKVAKKSGKAATAATKRPGESPAPAARQAIVPAAPTPPAGKPAAGKPAAGKPAPKSGSLLATADQAFAQKSYAAALRGYREAQNRGLVPAERRPEVEYRVVRCLGQTQQWEAALYQVSLLASRYPGKVWEARARSLQMQLYLDAEHSAYKVGDRYYRGQNVPEVESPEPPHPVDLTSEDIRKGLLAGEQAKTLYEKLRSSLPDASEEASFNADLARVVTAHLVHPWAARQAWKAPEDPAWALDPASPYDPTWESPKKALQLYLGAERIGKTDQKPLARLAQALWLRAYQELMPRYAWTQQGDEPRVAIPYPYQSRSALEVLKSLTRDYPQHPEAEHARLIAADWLNDDGRYVDALAAYQALIADRPEGKWTKDAKNAVAEITRLHLAIQPLEPLLPGKKATLRVSLRNVDKVRFAAYRVKLEEMVKDPRFLNRTQGSTSGILQQLGKLEGVRKFYQGEPVLWEAAPKERPPHTWSEEDFTTPLDRNGAYVVEAESGPVRSAVLLLITDLAAIQIVEADRSHALVMNAQTGAPVFGASALVREVYSRGDKDLVSAATYQTDAEGMAAKPHAKGRDWSRDILTLAWKGDRYAFTDSGYAGTGEGETRPRDLYVYSDRPVYRPGQTVFYRGLLAARKGSVEWKPIRDQKVRAALYDPKGTRVATADVNSGRFGTVHGAFELPSEAPLGAYQLHLEMLEGSKVTAERRHTLRVEEYKKPEFEVSVLSPPAAAGAGAPRAGDPVTAKISARYYFGAPVPKAKVKYSVTRKLWWPRSPFARPYGFLYSDGGIDRESWTRLEDQEVASGTAVTDAAGEAEIRIETAVKDPDWQGRHAVYVVKAEVTDASRRTIEGSGEVRVLATQFDAFVRLRKGFYTTGDRLTADIRTLDANGFPVSTSGTARVLRLTAREDETVETPVHTEALNTDRDGRAAFQWTADRPGKYAVRFEARDGWEQQVQGEQEVWVQGDAAGDGVFHDRHVTVVPEQNTYRVGQTARVLLVADQPGLNALLTFEAGNRILEKRMVRIEGRSQVLEIPLTDREAPDVTVALTGVRDGAFFRVETTLYVPPAQRLLDVTVTPDKERYKPGEQAAFRLRARDADGKPAETELSVGVVDASLFYIQGETAGPIASFFYAGERGTGISPQESMSLSFEALNLDAQPPVPDTRQAWSFPSGLGDVPRDNPFDVNSDFGALRHGGPRRRFQDAVVVMSPEPSAPSAGARSIGDGLSAGQALWADRALWADQALWAERGQAGEIPARTLPKSKTRAAPEIRKSFADTAFWTPAVVTGSDGEAVVRFPWPDNLTQWRATTRGWSTEAQVGEATADVETRKDLLVRLQAPRFFVERDEVVLSANVHNYTETDEDVEVRLDLEGGSLSPATAVVDGPPQPRELHVPRADFPELHSAAAGPGPTAASADPGLVRMVRVPKGGETRVDWRVRVERPGEAKVRVVAQGDADGDAMELGFPVYAHGVEKLVVKGGSMLMAPGEKPGSRTAKLSLEIPAERAPDSGELVVQVSPSVAATMLDALPYLVEYPYGCVEQTMSRFLPSVVVSKTLRDLGVDLKDLKRRAELERKRLAEALPKDRVRESAYTYGSGAVGVLDPDRLALDRWTWRAQRSPVYDPALLQKMTGEGLARLQQFRNEDGGWGWWQDDSSDPQMTAYVLQGLLAARAAGVQVGSELIAGAQQFLEKRFAKETSLHQLAGWGWVLAQDGKRAPAVAASLLERVYPKRETLTAYGLALLATALQRGGKAAEAKICVDNLENTARIDRDAGTCSWTRDSGAWWAWHNDDVETAAASLRAMLAVDPKNRLAPMVVRWLCNNRTGEAWGTTRETAFAVQALAEHVRVNRELAPDCTVTVEVAGKEKKSFKLDAATALLADGRLVIPAGALGSGPLPVTVTREGRGNVYYTAYLRYFTLEEGIRAAGNEIRVRRRYFRLAKPAPGSKPAGLTGDGYVRTAVAEGDRLTSGDLLEVELLLESKNSYEYLVFEDMKPAGCEPVELRSGSRYGDGLCSNMELRDEKVAFFVSHLPQGKQMITYRLRAEIPGAFHALPVNGYAMYAPAVRCISDEALFNVGEAQP